MANEDLARLKIDKNKVMLRPRKKTRTLYWAAGIILVVILLLLLMVKHSVQVQVTTVSQVFPSQGFTVLNASGYVVPQRKSALASKATGRLVWLGVEEGNLVKKGQVIARLENEDVVAAMHQAQANLNVTLSNLEQVKAELKDATLSYNRNKELVARGVIAQSAYDDALARYEKANAAVASAEAAIKANAAGLDSAKVAIEYTLIRVPFDAVVLTKDADVGDIVTPLGAAANAKASVITIADMGSLQVEADVSESNLNQVKAGQPCEVQLDAIPGERFRGEVHMLVPTVDRSKATVMVKVRFLEPDPRVLPEMSAKVSFLSRPVKEDEKKPVTAFLQTALIAEGEQKQVFVVKGDRLVKTPVRLGISVGEMVEVLEGVKAGDQIVLNPSNKLRNGSKIKIEQQ